MQPPQYYQVKLVDGKWQVFIEEANQWVRCHDKNDAWVIAFSPVVVFRSFQPENASPVFMELLKETTAAFNRNKLDVGLQILESRLDYIKRQIEAAGTS